MPGVDGPFVFGCVVIGLVLGILLPMPISLVASVPAGFIWADYYRNRR